MSPVRLALAALAVALPCCLPAGAQQLWRVDDDGPADFAVLQAAVDAAAPGDLILVRAGVYGAPLLNGKPLWIVREGAGSARLLGTTRIALLSAEQHCLLRGLELAGASPVLDASLGAGALLLEDCLLLGSSTQDALPAARLDGGWCSFVRCAVQGGQASLPSLSGGAALLATHCSLALFDCTLDGGAGGQGKYPSLGGGFGASALRLDAGALLLQGSQLRGGRGGDGGAHDLSWGGSICGLGGDGGAGLELLALPDSPLALASSWSGGPGGNSPGACPTGALGPAVLPTDFVLPLQAAPSVRAWTAGPTAVGQSLSLNLSGPPQAVLFAWYGTFDANSSSPLPLPTFCGWLLPSLWNGNLLALGALPSSGTLQLLLPISALHQAVVAVLLQPIACSASQCTLGSPTAIALFE